MDDNLDALLDSLPNSGRVFVVLKTEPLAVAFASIGEFHFRWLKGHAVGREEREGGVTEACASFSPEKSVRGRGSHRGAEVFTDSKHRFLSLG